MIKEVTYEELKPIYDIGTNSYRKYFTYINNNIVIGYFIIDIIYERMELIFIYVNENYRNNKIGSKMLEYICNLAKMEKIGNVTLEVNINNKYAIKLYEKYGFKKVALRKAYYNGVDGILMELLIEQ